MKHSVLVIIKKPASQPLIVVPACILAMLWYPGCAHVTISSTEDMKHPTPLHFYTESIPYLLVSKTKDGATASIFYLKDPKSVLYAQQHQGWGTANFTMSLSNGVLSTYGMQTDSKGPETITAVSGLLSSAATGFVAQSAVDYSPEGAELEAAVTSFNTSMASLQPLTKDAGTLVESLVVNLTDAAHKLQDPTLPTSVTTIALGQLKGASAQLTKLKGEKAIQSSGNPSGDTSRVRAFDDAKDTFGKSLIAILKDVGTATGADVQLYQIKQRPDGRISLVRASFPKG